MLHISYVYYACTLQGSKLHRIPCRENFILMGSRTIFFSNMVIESHEIIRRNHQIFEVGRAAWGEIQLHLQGSLVKGT